MAGREHAAIIAEDDEKFDTRGLVRLAAWGMCAAAALALAIWAARSDIGTKRANAAISAMLLPAEDPVQAPGVPAQTADARLASRLAEAERDSQRLAETVRSLASERERLSLRLAAIERNFGDLTGSIGRTGADASSKAAPAENQGSPRPAAPAPANISETAAAKPPESAMAPSSAPSSMAVAAERLPEPAPPSAATGAAAAATDAPVGIAGAPAKVPLPPPRPGPLASLQNAGASAAAGRGDGAQSAAAGEADTAALKVEFGVDLGPALTVARLRARWTSLQANYASLFERLRPVITLREIGKGAPVEMRLVAGPLANVNAATQLCAALAGTQFLCQPAVFDGQRLAVR